MSKATKNAPIIPKAVIYARVSSQKQVEEGNGLTSQKNRCESYAKGKGYQVERTFFEEGISGGLIDRPAMQDMLAYLEEHSTKTDPIAVVIDDISRLARGVLAHAELRTAITLAGGALQSPALAFGEDADSQLVEYLLATVSQHQRQKNAEQVRNRIYARWKQGYYTANPGMGYKYAEVKGHGKMLVPDEPKASLVREVFEGLASGRFASISEAYRFLDRHPDMHRAPSGIIPFQMVTDMLRRPIYAGYITIKNTDIVMHPAKHEPLVSFTTWQKVQDKLDGKMNVPKRKDVHEDFPMRGYVCCSSYGNAMTAAWSKGSTKSYAYYLCPTRKCPLKGKSIPKAQIEDGFLEIVRGMRPAPQLFLLARDLFKQFWDHRLNANENRTDALAGNVANIERKIDNLMERLLGTDSPSLISAYESQIQKLERKKIGMIEKTNQGIEPLKPFDMMFNAAMQFLANPCRIWENGNLNQKRLLLKMAFPDRLIYDREKGYRTPEIALPFKALRGLGNGIGKMVGVRRIELRTSSMSRKRSTTELYALNSFIGHFRNVA